ncbi:MAG: pyruvate formate lyase family protein [bacterium]
MLQTETMHTIEQLQKGCENMVKWIEGLGVIVLEGESIVGSFQQPKYVADEDRHNTIGVMSAENFVGCLPDFSSDECKAATKIGLISPVPGGHWIGGYDIVLKHGLRHKIEQAEARMAGLDKNDPDCERKRVFLECYIKVAESLIAYAHKYAAACLERAENETDPAERERLCKIADICQRVPEFPATTMQEAAQSFWFCYVIVSDGQGRLDQTFWPYYEADKKAGRITREGAKALLDEIQLKLNHNLSGPPFWLSAIFTLTIGGQKPDGTDATNDLTYIILEIFRENPREVPNLYVRWHPGSPPDLIREGLKTLREHGGQPAFYGDTALVSALERVGAPIEWARDYALSGCTEVIIPGKSHSIAVAGWLNAPMMVDNALTEAVKKGVTSFEELMNEVEAVERNAVRLMVDGTRDIAKSRAHCGNTFNGHGLFTEGCIEECRPYWEGVAPFRVDQVLPVGISNAADALYAINEVVFERKELTLAELRKALDANFEGYETLKKRLRALPKFGNDIEAVDVLAADMLKFMANEFDRYETYTKGRYALGVLMGGENVHKSYGM